jgi:hypothetical protein
MKAQSNLILKALQAQQVPGFVEDYQKSSIVINLIEDFFEDACPYLEQKAISSPQSANRPGSTDVFD